jgi:hypothetical protein
MVFPCLFIYNIPCLSNKFTLSFVGSWQLERVSSMVMLLQLLITAEMLQSLITIKVRLLGYFVYAIILFGIMG